MEIGYFTMPLHPPGSNIAKTLKEDLEQIVLLDGLGYKEAWIGEHFTAEWENIPAPDLFIAQALGLTENIILGTGVTCMPNHDPFMIAHRKSPKPQVAGSSPAAPATLPAHNEGAPNDSGAPSVSKRGLSDSNPCPNHTVSTASSLVIAFFWMSGMYYASCQV